MVKLNCFKKVHIPCGVKLMVRKCSHNDWHEPTAEYLGLKD